MFISCLKPSGGFSFVSVLVCVCEWLFMWFVFPSHLSFLPLVPSPTSCCPAPGTAIISYKLTACYSTYTANHTKELNHIKCTCPAAHFYYTDISCQFNSELVPSQHSYSPVKVENTCLISFLSCYLPTSLHLT